MPTRYVNPKLAPSASFPFHEWGKSLYPARPPRHLPVLPAPTLEQFSLGVAQPRSPLTPHPFR